MQEKSKIKSNFFDRIMQIAKYKGFKNISDFAKNALDYDSPEKLNRLKDPTKKPSVDILLDISNKFDFINMTWLLTGRGDMIQQNKVNDYPKNDTVNIVKESNEGNNYNSVTLKQHVAMLNGLLEEKDIRIKEKDLQIKEKDLQIKDLLQILKKK